VLEVEPGFRSRVHEEVEEHYPLSDKLGVCEGL
jgi:hypothetical protein